MDEDGKTEHYCFPGEGKGMYRKSSVDLVKDVLAITSMEPHMEVVFHDDSAVSSDDSESPTLWSTANALKRSSLPARIRVLGWHVVPAQLVLCICLSCI